MNAPQVPHPAPDSHQPDSGQVRLLKPTNKHTHTLHSAMECVCARKAAILSVRTRHLKKCLLKCIVPCLPARTNNHLYIMYPHVDRLIITDSSVCCLLPDSSKACKWTTTTNSGATKKEKKTTTNKRHDAYTTVFCSAVLSTLLCSTLFYSTLLYFILLYSALFALAVGDNTGLHCSIAPVSAISVASYGAWKDTGKCIGVYFSPAKQVVVCQLFLYDVLIQDRVKTSTYR